MKDESLPEIGPAKLDKPAGEYIAAVTPRKRSEPEIAAWWHGKNRRERRRLMAEARRQKRKRGTK